jgi:hypothetical protein
MGSDPKSDIETYSDEEAARRRDEVIRRMTNTPPQTKPKKAANANPVKKSQPLADPRKREPNWADGKMPTSTRAFQED